MKNRIVDDLQESLSDLPMMIKVYNEIDEASWKGGSLIGLDNAPSESTSN